MIDCTDALLQYKCLPINPYTEIPCQHDVTNRQAALNTVTSILREKEPKVLSLSLIMTLHDLSSFSKWHPTIFQNTRYVLLKHLLEKYWVRAHTSAVCCWVEMGSYLFLAVG